MSVPDAWPQGLLATIEQAAVRGWPALEQAEVDGWIYRYSTGGSIRGNSVAALHYSGTDAGRSVAHIEALAAARNGVACFTISDVSAPAGLDAVLAQRGYVRGDDHVTMAKRIVYAPQPPPGMAIGDGPSEGWMTAYLSGLEQNRREAAPKLLKGLPKTARYVSATAEGRVISCGLTIVDGSVASIQCMATVPEARRQGGAMRVLAAIETIAGVKGASYLYLQTGGENKRAQALYERAGFRVIGHYHTRSKRLGAHG